jgi:hypothetical protein
MNWSGRGPRSTAWALAAQFRVVQAEAGRLGIELFVFQRGTGLQRQYALFGIGREGATQEGAYARRLTIELDRLVKEDGLEIPDLTERLPSLLQERGWQ